MVKESSLAPSYYHAGKDRVELVPAEDLFAVEGSPAAADSGSSRPPGSPLAGGLRLLTREELGDAAGELQRGKPKYPVYRAHGAVLIALPEVRVEESRPAYRRNLDRWLDAHSDEVAVISRDEDRLVLKPVSGSGVDALAIANGLARDVDPEIAQARFLRVTPQPEPTRRR